MRQLRTAYRIAGRSHSRGERGATAIEFALVAPVFFLLVFAIIEFGWYFFVEHAIHHATREGTRLALVGIQLEEGGTPMSREDSIISTIQDNAAMAVEPDDLLISIYPVDPANGYADPEGWEGTVDAGAGGSYMRVRTRYTYTFITPLMRVFFPGGSRLIRASTLFRNELF